MVSIFSSCNRRVRWTTSGCLQIPPSRSTQHSSAWGTGNVAEIEALESLGGAFLEAMWFFHRGLDFSGGLGGAVAGKVVSIGPAGSASNASARAFLEMNNVDPVDAHIRELQPVDAAARLQDGTIDAMFISSAARNAVIDSLLRDRDLALRGFPRSDTYVALFPVLTKVVVPAGLGSLSENLPPEDVDLLAFTTLIVVREELHDAIQSLLLEAASVVHAKPDIFHRYGQFPSAASFDLPLSPVAVRYYESGRPFLYRYLPFWLAVLVMQIIVAAIPVLGVLYPAARLMPSVSAGR